MDDDHLTWKDHISYISSKLSKSIGIIGRVGKLIPRETRVNLYNSLLLPYFAYCQVVWGVAGPSFLKRLIVLQKKAVRAINLASFRAHTHELFHDDQNLPVQSMNQYYSSIFLFECIHENFPPSFRTTFGQRSLKYSLSKLFNNFIVPLDLHEVTLYTLKRHLKGLLLWYTYIFLNLWL